MVILFIYAEMDLLERGRGVHPSLPLQMGVGGGGLKGGFRTLTAVTKTKIKSR
jgi:hypothetical protein